MIRQKLVERQAAIVLKSQKIDTMGIVRVSPKAAKRLLKVVDRYNAFLKRRFPTAYETQESVFRGFRQLFRDAATYAVLMNDRYNGKSLSAYNRSELELMWSFPTDMTKIIPTMAVLTLPFSTFVVIPLLVLYPRIMSPPFWTPEQHREFFTHDLQWRSNFYHHVLRDMEKSLPLLDATGADETVDKLKQLICQVSYGMCVEPSKLIEQKGLKHAFRQFPFAVPYMRWRYAYDLLELHGLHLLPFYNIYALFRPRTVLFRYAMFMRNMDLAIAREGLASLSDDDLNRACFMRSFLPFDAKREAKEDFLNKWLSYTVGEEKSDMSPSLYLHLPIFWSYMQLQNKPLFRQSVPK